MTTGEKGDPVSPDTQLASFIEAGLETEGVVENPAAFIAGENPVKADVFGLALIGKHGVDGARSVLREIQKTEADASVLLAREFDVAEELVNRCIMLHSHGFSTARGLVGMLRAEKPSREK